MFGTMGGNGVFGLGGIGGISPAMPEGMAAFYDPETMKRAKIKALLTGAGAAMLGQGPSDRPMNFGTSLGQGLSAGVDYAQQAEQDYRKNAYDAYKLKADMDAARYAREQDAKQWEWKDKEWAYNLKRQATADRYAAEEQAHNRKLWGQQDAQRAQYDDWIASLPQDQQSLARAFPDRFAQQFLEKQFNTSRSGGSALDEVNQRKMIAESNGMTPDDPAYKSYVMTGKMPREDQAPLTATDKKAILEADDAVATNQNVINTIDQALLINDKANSGYTASARAFLGNNLPDLMVPDRVSSEDSSQATVEYENLVNSQALQQLKTIFGGNPTEGERAILLDLQASVSKPPAVRANILKKAKALAERRLGFNLQRAKELRGQTYYKPEGAPQTDGWSIEEVP